MKKLIMAIVVFLAFNTFVSGVSAAPGDMIWSKTSNPSGAANSVAVDSTGVYIVGYDYAPGNEQWRMEKRNPTTGALIWSKTSNPSSGWDEAFDVAVDSTGVYIVGCDSYPGNARWRIEKRSLTTGVRIWVKTSNPSSTFDVAYGVAVDSTGLYIAGHDHAPGNWEWRIEKRNLATGSLIWSKTSNPSSGWDIARGVAVDGTGVYIVGCDSAPGNREWRVEKRVR